MKIRSGVGRVLFCLGILTLCGHVIACNSSTSVEVSFNGASYHIPRRNLVREHSGSPYREEQLDPVPSLYLTFSANEAGESIPGFKASVRGARGRTIEENLGVIVSLPSEATRPRIESGAVNEALWRGTGDYGTANGLGRRIERDGSGIGFRVYYEGIDNNWTLVDRDPHLAQGAALPPFNAVIAACRGLIGSPQAYSCRRVAYAGSNLIEYSVHAENVQHYQAIDRFILGRLQSWHMQ